MALVAEFTVCRGINNRDKSYRLSVGKDNYNVLELVNFDITNRGSLVKRGSLSLVDTGNYNYLYNFKDKLCYVKNGVFYFDNNSIMPVKGEVKYTTNNEYLFLTDNRAIYKIADNGSYEILSGRREFEMPYYSAPSIGHLITYALGSLYIARNNRVTYTLPFRFDTVDIRKNIMYFPSYIRMLVGTSKGIYVGDMDGVYFLSPSQDDGFTVNLLLKERVYKNSAVEVNLHLINEKLNGKGVLFITDGGLYLGSETGEIANLNSNYKFTEGKSATVRIEDGIYQYIYV